MLLSAMLLSGVLSQVQGQTLSDEARRSAAYASPVADTGAVLVYNGWYLPSYRPKGTEADTTGALVSLFRKRRTAGWLFTLPFMAGMCLALPISTTDRYGQTQVAEEAISPPLGVAVLAGTVTGFVLHASKYNKSHLQRVSQEYAAGKPIPAKYRRNLNAQHFAEAAYLREALRQQKAREMMRAATR
ncbi:hypothetical protein B0919_21185 [Hymenobacter sp. CRA2]|nr:hypothetical protein B0919_21185 [Hymenobacter sp. CRA2]